MDSFLDYLARPDRRRFRRFMREYAPAMTRLARRMAPSDDVAGDIVQEAFLRLADPETRPGEVKNPRAYVLRAVHNLAHNVLRDERTRKTHERKAALRIRNRSRIRSHIRFFLCDPLWSIFRSRPQQRSLTGADEPPERPMSPIRMQPLPLRLSGLISKAAKLL